MSARASGSAVVTFGLASIPVRLFPTTRRRPVSRSSATIESDDEGRDDHRLGVLAFVPLDALDVVLVRSASYLAAGPGGDRGYALLALDNGAGLESLRRPPHPARPHARRRGDPTPTAAGFQILPRALRRRRGAELRRGRAPIIGLDPVQGYRRRARCEARRSTVDRRLRCRGVRSSTSSGTRERDRPLRLAQAIASIDTSRSRRSSPATTTPDRGRISGKQAPRGLAGPGARRRRVVRRGEERRGEVEEQQVGVERSFELGKRTAAGRMGEAARAGARPDRGGHRARRARDARCSRTEHPRGRRACRRRSRGARRRRTRCVADPRRRALPATSGGLAEGVLVNAAIAAVSEADREQLARTCDEIESMRSRIEAPESDEARLTGIALRMLRAMRNLVGLGMRPNEAARYWMTLEARGPEGDRLRASEAQRALVLERWDPNSVGRRGRPLCRTHGDLRRPRRARYRAGPDDETRRGRVGARGIAAWVWRKTRAKR